jgi:hypothetical protein
MRSDDEIQLKPNPILPILLSRCYIRQLMTRILKPQIIRFSGIKGYGSEILSFDPIKLLVI